MNNKLEKIKSTITYENKLIIIISFIAGLITHFYFLTNEAIAPDSLGMNNYFKAGTWETSLGRWAIPIIDTLRGGLVSNVLITFFCILVLTITTILIVKLFKIKNKKIIILISILMVTAPQFAETLMFIYCADSYCIAMLLSVLAVYYIYKESSIKNYLFSAICIIFSLALYQSYIGVTVSLCIIIPIIDLINREDSKKVLKNIGKSILIGIISALSYYLITKLILLITGNNLAEYGGANEMGISMFYNLLPEILSTYKTFFGYFFGENIIYNQYWHRDLINFIILMITIVNIVFIIIQNKTYNKKTSIIILIILLTILPIGINIINIIAPERNSNLLMSMSYVLIYIFALKIIECLNNKQESTILKNVIFITISVLIITFVFSNNASYMARKEIYNNYYSTSMRILNKIENYEGYKNNTPVLIGGIIKYKPYTALLGNGFISNDYETWTNYDGVRMINNFYFKYMGTKIRLCSKVDYTRIVESEEYKNMEKFPYDNSIKMIDGILVVKLEDNPVR